MDSLEFHFRDTPDIIIWFDMFSNNQHKAVDLDFNWWCNTFKSAIKDFGHTVMVFAPWKNPIPMVIIIFYLIIIIIIIIFKN